VWFSTAPPDKQQPLTIIMKAMKVSFHNYSFTSHIPRYMTSAVITWPKNNRITIQPTTDMRTTWVLCLSHYKERKPLPGFLIIYILKTKLRGLSPRANYLYTVNGILKVIQGGPTYASPHPSQFVKISRTYNRQSCT
jgi:hypothetical protein